MKDTISISELRRDIFRVFDLFKQGGSIRVSYRRKIYVFSISPTGDKVTTPYRKSPANAMNKIDPHSITQDVCPECEDLRQNGVCMNRKCESNRPMSENEAVVA